MKIISLFLVALFLVPAFAPAQALPDNPTPAPAQALPDNPTPAPAQALPDNPTPAPAQALPDNPTPAPAQALPDNPTPAPAQALPDNPTPAPAQALPDNPTPAPAQALPDNPTPAPAQALPDNPTPAPAQALPDNPTPAPASDPAWERLQSLAPNEPIVVRNDNGPPVHCLFSAATDAYLFCDPPGNPPGVGFRFDRAAVISVDLDLPSQTGAQFAAPQRNYHPVWISSMLGAGLFVGLIASRATDAGGAAQAGAIAAGVVGLIGAPLAFLPRPASFAGNDPLFPQFGVGIPLHRLHGLNPHLLPRNQP